MTMRHPDLEAVGRAPAQRLKKRPDFLHVASGRKIHGALFTLQTVQRPDGVPAPARVGFTVTKKVGNAVERNRIRRRLREIVRTAPDLGIKPSHDYVIVARRAVLDEAYPALVSGLRSAFGRMNRPASPGKPRREHRPPASRDDVRP